MSELTTAEGGSRPRPAVLVAHEGPGLDAHARYRTEKLAELGYIALGGEAPKVGRIVLGAPARPRLAAGNHEVGPAVAIRVGRMDYSLAGRAGGARVEPARDLFGLIVAQFDGLGGRRILVVSHVGLLAEIALAQSKR